jgi:formamidopyrimidine-DNA glycosylase-like protein
MRPIRLRDTGRMPELPDVEHFRRFFRDHAAGKRVTGVWADPTILRNATPQALETSVRGTRLDDPDRLGKWLICPTDGPFLLLHFGMTGDLIWSRDEPSRHRHDRLALELDDGGELRYRNMRKLGGVWETSSRTKSCGRPAFIRSGRSTTCQSTSERSSTRRCTESFVRPSRDTTTSRGSVPGSRTSGVCPTPPARDAARDSPEPWRPDAPPISVRAVSRQFRYKEGK